MIAGPQLDVDRPRRRQALRSSDDCRASARSDAERAARHHRGDAGGADPGAGHDHRQRRPAAHAGEPRRDPGKHQLGPDQLYRRLGDRAADLPAGWPTGSGGSGCCSGRWSASPSPRSSARLRNRCRKWSAFRVLQGVTGAFLVPLAQATLFDINPRERHAQAMALFGGGIMIGPILGPGAGRLADRQLQLALGVPGQHPDRRRCAALMLLRFMPKSPRSSASLRPVRHLRCSASRSAHCS